MARARSRRTRARRRRTITPLAWVLVALLGLSANVVPSAGIRGESPEIRSFPPARVLDTRPGRSTVDGRHAGDGPRSAGSTLELQIAGRGGVGSTGVEAVVINVAAVGPGAAGYLTVFPCDRGRPLTSSLNYAATTVAVANEIVAGLSADGALCVYTSAAVDLVADVVGEVPDTSSIEPVGPSRLFDSRPGQQTVDGAGLTGARVAAGSTTELAIAGRGGVDADARAVLLNITAVQPSAAGFLTVFDCGRRPLASSLNYDRGEILAVEVVAGLSADGTACLFALGETDLVVDVVGQLTDTTTYVPVTPVRLLETRRGQGTVDGLGKLGRMLPMDTQTALAVGGRGGVPSSGVGAVVLSVAAVQPATAGFVKVFPCGVEPLASSLNHGAGQTIANEVITALDDTGSICVVNSAHTHLIVDVVGFVPT